MLSKKIIDLAIIIGFFLLPIILFLRPENLAQSNIYDLVYLFISQTILFFIFFLSSLFIYRKFFKKIILFIDFLCLNSFIFFLLFYYKKFNLIFEKIDRSKLFVFNDIKISLIDNLIVIIIYLLIYFIFLKLIQNFNKKVKNFFFLFISLNVILFLFNSIPNFKQGDNLINDTKNKNILTNLENINLQKNNNNTNIFIIVLDGMIGLDRAEKELIIVSKTNVKKKLENFGFNYNENFKSNYSSTYLSVATLLTGNYPVTPTSPKYSNRKDFFPNMMSKTNNYFYKIISKLNTNFVWIGNYWGPCVPNIYTMCLNNESNLSYYLTKVSRMYDDSIFRYLTIYYFKKFPFPDSYELLTNTNDFLKSYKIRFF